MIRAELVICTEKVIRDSSSNQVSFINIIQELTPPSLPSLVQSLNLFVVLRRDDGDPQNPKVRVKIVMENGYKQDVPLDVDFQDKLGTRMHTEFQGFPILVSGEIVFSVLHEDTESRELGRWVIHVAQPPTPRSAEIKVKQLSETPEAETTS